MTDILDDDELQPPGKPDFRRVGRWNSPQVVMPNGKRSTYGRFSNAGKLLDDESNLNDWKLCTTIWGAAFRPELMAQASTLHIKADRNALRDIAEECLKSGKGKERSVKGEAIHAMFDHLDMGDDWEPAPQWKELCDAYLATLNLWGLHASPDEVEINCVSHRFRLAGRMDRRYKTRKVLVTPDNRTIPIGSMIAADTKTGAVLEYAAGSYATQLAGYSVADKYDVTTDETIPFDPPTYQDWGLVVHADSGSTEVHIYWVDLKAGLEGLKLSQAIKGWRQRADLLTLGNGPVMANSAPQLEPTELIPVGTEHAGLVMTYGNVNLGADIPIVMPDPELEVALAAATAPEGRGLAPVVPQDGSRLASLLQHTRERVRAVLGHSDIAGKALQRNWPVGIPGLKAGTQTWDQLQAIIAVVEQVEADHSVPFFPPWADSEDSRDRHPSNWVDKWANPKPDDPPTQEAVDMIAEGINQHPRKELLRQWVGKAVEGGIDTGINTYALAHALMEFASINTEDWSVEPWSHDEALTIFLEGTLRALGYNRGLLDLGRINPEHAPAIMSAALSITSGTGVLLYQADGTPVFRSNVVKA